MNQIIKTNLMFLFGKETKMYKECNILSPLLKLKYPIFTEDCENELYKTFCLEYKDAVIMYEKLPVQIRRDPLWNQKEETFWHFISNTHQNGHIGEYIVDETRAKRLLWAKDLILNSPCQFQSKDHNCKGIFIWDVPYRKTFRRKFLHVKYSQLLVIEKRENYWLLITCHKLDNFHKKEEIKKYNEAISKKRLTV